MSTKNSQEKLSPFAAATDDSEKDTATPSVRKANTEKVVYKRVKFHTKSEKNQPNDVILTSNGVTLLIQRDKEIVIPQEFLNVADEAVYEQYRTGSGAREVIAKVRRYPYDLLGDATKEDYMSMRADGTRRQAEARQRDEAVQIIR